MTTQISILPPEVLLSPMIIITSPELLLWFGLDGAANFEQVLPNLDNFYEISDADTADPSTLPIGFLKPNAYVKPDAS